MPCCSGRFIGGSAVEAGGGVVAHGRQLQAARSSCPLLFFRCFVLLSPLSLWSGFPLCAPCLFLSQTPSPVSNRSSFLSFFLFHLLPFTFLLFLLFSPSCVGVESSIYRANGSGGVPIAVLLLRMGSRAFLPCHGAGLVGQWAWLAGRGSPDCSSWEGVGHSTRGGREAERIKEEKIKVISSPTACPGEEEGGIVSLKTTLFCSLFFNMKRRRFGQNASFHLNKIWRQNRSTSKSVLNLSFVHLSPQMQFWF